MKEMLFISCLLMQTFGSFAQAQDAVAPSVLSADLAQKLVSEVLACGRSNGWKLTAAVVNAEGNLLSFTRDDGASLGSIMAAQEKAKSSNAFTRPTSAFTEALAANPPRLGLLTMPGVVAIEGGQQIKINEQHVGALGVSGARAAEDDKCAIESLTKLSIK